MDKIVLRNMTFYGYHGVYAEENRLGQRYAVDLELHMPLDKPGLSDELGDSVNYAEVCTLVQEIVEGPPLKLIEAVAERIASEVLRNYTGIQAVTVRVIKPNPPVAIRFDGVSVEIHRKRA